MKRVLTGITAVWGGQLISMAEAFAIVPIYLAYWSAGRYGEWLALSALVAYLGTLDFGMNMAGGNKLTQLYAKGDLAEYDRYQRAALFFYMGIAVVGTAVLGLLAVFLPISQLLGFHDTTPREAGLVTFLLGSQVLWSLPGGLIMGIYRTTGDLATSQWVRNSTSIIGIAASAACLLFGGGMATMATVQLTCLAIGVTGVLIDVHRRFPELMPSLWGADMVLVRELVRPSALFGMIILSEAVRLQGTVLLISSLLGGPAVALFVSSRTLCNAVRQLAGNLQSAFWPHITALDAQKRESTMRDFHRLWVLGSITSCVCVAAAIWFEGTDVIRVWTHGKLVGDSNLLRLLLLQLVLQSPWQASSLITAASSKHDRLSYSYLASSATALLIAALTYSRLGLIAIPVGSISAEAIFCYHFVTVDTCKRIAEQYWPFAARQWSFLGLVWGLALLAAWGMHIVAFGPSPFRWAEVGIASSTAAVAVFWIVGLGASERNMIKGLAGVVRAR